MSSTICFAAGEEFLVRDFADGHVPGRAERKRELAYPGKSWVNDRTSGPAHYGLTKPITDLPHPAFPNAYPLA